MKATIALDTSKTSKQSSGFSLIEILVAMAIVAVMVGMAVPYLGNSNDKYAKQEINRLLAAVEMVRDLAVIEGREYGLSITETGYQFLLLNEEATPAGQKKPGDGKSAESSARQSTAKAVRWEVIGDHPELGEHEFPDTVEVNLSIDGENIFKKQQDEVQIFEKDVDIFEDEDEMPEVEPPQIYFLSTGEQNQFTVGVSSSDQYQSDKDDPKFYRIQGSLTGELKIQGPLPGNLFNDIERDYSDYLARD